MIEEEFQKAIEKIKKIDKLSDDNKLKLYGYYKQATIGIINISKPSFWNMTAVAKWNAWNYCKDMSKENAKQNYINFVNLLLK